MAELARASGMDNQDGCPTIHHKDAGDRCVAEFAFLLPTRFCKK
jgi:hypothetical protein